MASIEVGLDVSWLLIFALVTVGLAVKFGAEHGDWTRVEAWGSGFVASVLFFGSILLHELGHSITSNLLGLPVRSITLFVFGGLAKLSGKPTNPRDEFLIGLAGPAVSVILGGVFLAVAAAIPDAPHAAELPGAILSWLGTINLILAAFNLFPGHPLDGGHLLHAVIWAVTGKEKLATGIASAFGTAFAVALIAVGALFVLFGAIGGLWLVLIGWFLMRASKAPVLQAVLEDRLSRVAASEAMADHCPTVDADETVENLIAGAILRQGMRNFCVEEHGELVGLVTLNEVKRVPVDERGSTRVGEIMVPREELGTIEHDETLWEATKRMDELGVNQLPVTRDGRLIGVLSREQLLRVLHNQMDLESRS